MDDVDDVEDVEDVDDGNAELARRGWEAASRGDFDVIAGLMDPDVKWHGGDPTAVGSCQNRNQALQWMQRAREHRPLPELVDVRGAGERVVLILRAPTAAQGTAAPDDGALFANVTTFRDGKVVEMVHYDDAGDALRAVGLEE